MSGNDRRHPFLPHSYINHIFLNYLFRYLPNNLSRNTCIPPFQMLHFGSVNHKFGFLVPILKNVKHEKFAQGVAKGISAVEAYEAAGYKPHRQAASRLLTEVDISCRVEELKKQFAERAITELNLTREYILQKLYEIGTDAHKDGQYNAATNAFVKLGEESFGMFVTKTKSEHIIKRDPKELNDDDLAAIAAGVAIAAPRATH